MPDIFTVDVEDWFHILETKCTPALASWDVLPSRLEQNLRVLLELLASENVKGTFFTLGWVARRFPGLLREAVEQGHEIASHGFAHQLVHSLSRSQFREDIRIAKQALEEATGFAVKGYRAPGFSITQDTPWAFEEIAEAGYSYDSSVFPSRHGHGGVPSAPRTPWPMRCSAGLLTEFPISVAETPIGSHCFFGGGYLRLSPLRLTMSMAERVHREGRGVIWYIHPREIDPDHPRLPMSWKRRYKSYVNLRGTAKKLKAILRSGPFATMGELAQQITESGQFHTS